MLNEQANSHSHKQQSLRVIIDFHPTFAVHEESNYCKHIDAGHSLGDVLNTGRHTFLIVTLCMEQFAKCSHFVSIIACTPVGADDSAFPMPMSRSRMLRFFFTALNQHFVIFYFVILKFFGTVFLLSLQLVYTNNTNSITIIVVTAT